MQTHSPLCSSGKDPKTKKKKKKSEKDLSIQGANQAELKRHKTTLASFTCICHQNPSVVCMGLVL